MDKVSRSVTKITRPGTKGVYHRQRLFRRLDRALGCAIVWGNAPPGSGKTTLLADYLGERRLKNIWYGLDASDSDAATFFHYLALAVKKAAPRRRSPLPALTPEYLMGLSAFTKGFFHELSTRLGPPFCLVLDNYQELSADSPVHAVVAGAAEAMPRGGVIVVLSRQGPPPLFSGLRAEGLLEEIGPAELCLTEKETRGMMRLKAGLEWKEEEDRFRELLAGIKGWAGGLVLLMEGLSKHSLGGLEPKSLKDLSHDRVFDYFAGVIFDGLEAGTRDFLMKTAILPQMTPEMARRLTGNRDAERILSRLSRENYFTERRRQPVAAYRYHPLFREFLLKRANEAYALRRLADLMRSGAALLEEEGQDEAAAVLYARGRDWESLGAIVMRLGPRLLSEGRSVSLLTMLRNFPATRLNRSPWLLYWLGAATAQGGPAEAKLHFARAFGLFDAASDVPGLFLSWAGAVRAIFFEFRDFRRLDRWIDLLSDLMERYPAFPSKEIETEVTAAMSLALLFRQPGHPRIRYWAGRARLLAERTENENMRAHIFMHLCFYYQFTGEVQKGRMLGERLLERKGLGKASPLTRLVAATVMACYHCVFGEYRACTERVAEGLDLARSSGVRIMDCMILGQGTSAALAEGDTAAAAAYLKKMSPVLDGGTAFDMSFYYFLMAWRGLVERRPSFARRYAWMAKDLSVAVGSPYAEVLSGGVLALALHECGDHGNASLELARMRSVARHNGYAFFNYLCLMIEAHMALEKGGGEKAMRALEKFFSIGRKFGFLKHHLFIPHLMTGLCKKALEEGIETEHVKRLICECSFVPDPPPVEMEEWPWPVRIFTLGRFSIIRRGQAVKFQGKSMKKPTEMLKVIIALGGRDIPEANITDIFWPDAEGHASHRSFTITLYRLRAFLDCPGAITLINGCVSLDPGCCRVDTWAFERAMRGAEKAIRRGERSRAMGLFGSAVEMYHGEFLPGDTEAPWSIKTRERLRSKFMRCASDLGKLLEEAGEYEKAADSYSRAIEVDSLAEGIYRSLMLCYRAMGRRAEAMALYRRLERVLEKELGLRPRPSTEALYMEIKRER